MTSIIAKAGIAALISIAAITGVTSTAAAREPSFGFGIYIDSPGYGGGYHDGYGRDRDREYGHRRGCRPWQAVNKAERFGVHRAYVADVGRRRVVVEGRKHHRPVRLVFANVPGCPLIRY